MTSLRERALLAVLDDQYAKREELIDKAVEMAERILDEPSPLIGEVAVDREEIHLEIDEMRFRVRKATMPGCVKEWTLELKVGNRWERIKTLVDLGRIVVEMEGQS